MIKHSPENERIKREYLDWLTHARGQSESTLEAVASALHRFEIYTRFKAFEGFHRQQAVAFKRHLGEQVSKGTGERLSRQHSAQR